MSCATTPQAAFAATWRSSASATLTETYTSNANYSIGDLAQGDWVTSVSGNYNLSGQGARLKINGSVGVSAILYATQSQNNTIAPTANVSASLEAIERFAFVDAQASVTQTFASPFGPQPGNIVNATQNRYTQQAYSLSPYIKGVLGSSEISYQLRDDNYWTYASNFGDSSVDIPSTYSNNLTFSMNGPAKPIGWTLTYNRNYYSNGLSGSAETGQDTFQTASFLAYYPYRIDAQLQVSARYGYEWNDYPTYAQNSGIYGVGVDWSPTERTHVSGFWDHRFFGSSYSWQLSHRLPNAALTGNFTRGISTYPQVALAIPAGTTVAQFVDLAFTTRIPDPVARQQAVEQFLARTGLPPTLAAPVSYYATSLTLQTSGSLTLLLIGALNSVSLTAFYSRSEAITTTGAELPPLFAASQDNTQRGVGIGYSHRLTGSTNLSASANYSTTTVNTETGTLAGARSNNAGATVSLNTNFSPKTSGSAGVGYSWSETPGVLTGTTTTTTSAVNVYVTVTHTF